MFSLKVLGFYEYGLLGDHSDRGLEEAEELWMESVLIFFWKE